MTAVYTCPHGVFQGGEPALPECHGCVADEREALREAVKEAHGALSEIALGKGPFSFDRLAHAEGCIEAMKSEATAALARLTKWLPPEEAK